MADINTVLDNNQVIKIDQGKEENSPDLLSDAYKTMFPRWYMIASLLGGTEVLREKGRSFLPQFVGEDDNRYKNRLSVATLLNMYELTLDALVGKPFSLPIKVPKDVPDKITNLFQNIDLDGSNLTQFCRKWFYNGLAYGMSAILIDFPTKPENATESDTQDFRPYWTLIDPRKIIYLYSKVDAYTNVPVLTHVRIKDTYSRLESGKFKETIVERITVFDKEESSVFVTIYEKADKEKKFKQVGDKKLIDGLSYIPLVIFYSNDKEQDGLVKPPFLDLAYLNVKHWQADSEQANVMTVARFPMLASSGGLQGDEPSKKLKVAPYSLLSSPDAAGRFYYVEHSGKAIASGRQEILDLEDRMANYGAEFLKRKPGNLTATARALDGAEAVSQLQAMTLLFINSLNKAISVTADWLGIEEKNWSELTIATEFSEATENEKAELDILDKARTRRDLSRTQFLTNLKIRGLLEDDFDISENKKEIDQENSSDEQALKTNTQNNENTNTLNNDDEM